MQQLQTSAADRSSFAGILTALANPGKARPTAWDDDLEDDVATLSYERALRAHARYKAPGFDDQRLTKPSQAEPQGFFELVAAQDQPCAVHDEPRSEDVSPPDETPLAAAPGPAASDAASRNLKSASVTVRLSTLEYAQLHSRAAEAGLTVSAYLRSCTFEAESLRALVKDALAQLKTEPATGDSPASQSGRQGIRHWLTRIWPRARVGRGSAHA